MANSGRYGLAPHQVPSPPQSDDWIDILRWYVAVSDVDDPDLPFMADLLATVCSGKALTARKAKAANAVLNSATTLWRHRALACQQPFRLHLVEHEERPHA